MRLPLGLHVEFQRISNQSQRSAHPLPGTSKLRTLRLVCLAGVVDQRPGWHTVCARSGHGPVIALTGAVSNAWLWRNAGSVASRVARRRAFIPRPGPRPHRRRAPVDDHRQVSKAAWQRLAGCTAAAALLQVDGTLITVALPSLARGLHVSTAATSIVLTAYFAAYGLTLLPGGALVDRLGPRRVALCGLVVSRSGWSPAPCPPTSRCRPHAPCARSRRRPGQPRGAGRCGERIPTVATWLGARHLGCERRGRGTGSARCSVGG